MSMDFREHAGKPFDGNLRSLTQLVSEMGGHVEKQLTDSIEALSKSDRHRAQRVVAADTTVDQLQTRIEQLAIATIGTHQPMVIDPRDIVSILRIAGELERIGDLAKNICKRVAGLNGDQMPRKALRGVRHIAGLVQAQLRNALDCFARRDSAIAVGVWTKDEEIDAMYTSLFRELLTYMMEDRGMITFSVHLLFCAKNIERMGDHATNIAEAVYYMVEGHSFPYERPKADATTELHLLLPH